MLFFNNKYQRQTKESIKKGALGRLIIPSVNINVAVYQSSMKTSEAYQKVVDDEDSALIYDRYNMTVLVDHAGQTFTLLHKVNLETKAYLYQKDKVTTFRCVGKFIGKDDNHVLVFPGGERITGTIAPYLFYCCKDNEDGRYLTFWEEV